MDNPSANGARDSRWVPQAKLKPSLCTSNKEPTNSGRLWSGGTTPNASLSTDGTTIAEMMSRRAILFQYFRADIDPAHTDVLLVICGFVGGLVDGLAFNAWGSFVSMQTGNSVFVALGAAGLPVYPEYLWAKSLIALTTYLVSIYISIRVSRALGTLRRSTMILSFWVQTFCLLAAALIVQLEVVSSMPEDPRAPIEWLQVLPITLLSFQAGGQICASRVLGFDEMPTVVLTTLMCDLLVDQNLTAPLQSNPKRNRRIASFLALFLGAMTAGGLSKIGQMVVSLWLAMGLKLVITVALFVWRRGEWKEESNQC